MVPGAPMDDAPVSGSRTGWLLGAMDTRFQLLYYVEDASQISAAQAQALAALAHDGIRVEALIVSRRAGSADSLACLHDVRGVAFQRYDARPGTAYLIRPDQHVAARWRTLDKAQLRAAVARACGRS
jgi:3-(3-hydroxy-phenyl)propionate hydroxylase